jgi:hypothetical protein
MFLRMAGFISMVGMAINKKRYLPRIILNGSVSGL